MDGAIFGKCMEGVVRNVLVQHSFQHKVTNDVYLAIRNVMKSCLRADRGFQIFMAKRVCEYYLYARMERCVASMLRSHMNGGWLLLDTNEFFKLEWTNTAGVEVYKTRWKKNAQGVL